MQIERVRELIEAGLVDCEVVVEGDGAHFMAVVVHPDFEGKSRIQRQQMVYNTVRNELMDGSLHALSVKTYTPDEWQTLNG